MGKNHRRSKTADPMDHVRQALSVYQAGHPQARVDLFRENSASIYVRIIDPDLAGVDRLDRHEQVWHYLESLSDSILTQLTVLLLLTPEEARDSVTSRTFDNRPRLKKARRTLTRRTSGRP